MTNFLLVGMDKYNKEDIRRPAATSEVLQVLAPITAATWPPSKANGLLELMETIIMAFIPVDTKIGPRRGFLLTVTPGPTAPLVKRYLNDLICCGSGLSSLNIILLELKHPLEDNHTVYNVPEHVVDKYIEDINQCKSSPPIFFSQWQYYVDNLISRADEVTPAPSPINLQHLPDSRNGKSGEWPIITLQNTPALNIRGVIRQARNILDTYGVLVLRPQSSKSLPNDRDLKKLFGSIKSRYIQEGLESGFLFKHEHQQVASSPHYPLLHCRSKVTLTEEKPTNKMDRKSQRRVLDDILRMKVEGEPLLYEANSEWVQVLCNSSNLPETLVTALFQLPSDPSLHFEACQSPLVIRRYKSSELLHEILRRFGKSIHQFFQPDCILSHALLFSRCKKDLMEIEDENPLIEENIEHLLEEVLMHPEWNQAPLFHGDTRYTFQTSSADITAPVYRAYFNFFGQKEGRTWVLLNKVQRDELEKHVPYHPSNLPIAPMALTTGNIPFVAGQQKKGDIVIVSPGTMWYSWGRYIDIGLSMNFMLDTTVSISSAAQDEVSEAFRELASGVADQTALIDSTWKKTFSRSLEPQCPFEQSLE